MIYFKYNNPIGRKLLNYNSFLKSLTRDKIKSILNNNCDCNTSDFKYEPHQHVITGDLSIISNNDLKKIMYFGTKYREPIHKIPKT